MAVTTTGVIAAIGAAAAGAGAASSIRSAGDARAQGDRAEDQEREATAERIRRLRLQRESVLGAQNAGAAAGGVDVGSASVRALQAETVAEFDRQIAFTQRAGAFAAEAAELQGRTVAYQNLSSGLSSLATAVRLGAEAGESFGLFGDGGP